VPHGVTSQNTAFFMVLFLDIFSEKWDITNDERRARVVKEL
jgi:hypothetical protein